MSETPEHHGDAERWRTLMTVVAIVTMGAAVFMAGVSWGAVNTTAATVAKLEAKVSTEVVMKNGQEMEQLRGQLTLINEKLATLVNQGAKR